MAVAIVLFHCGMGWSYNVAVSGVTFFFISSTFLMARNHPFEKIEHDEYQRFVLGHALRLYPLHWLGLALLIAVSLIFNIQSVDWGDTLLSAALLHSWSPAHDIHYGLNPVAWYMCALLFCYFIYPFMANALRPWRLRHKALLAMAMAVILGFVLFPLNIPQREAIFVNPASHVLEVTVGLTLFHLYLILHDRWPRVDAPAATLIELGALMLLVAVIAVNVTTTCIRPWEDVIIWLLPQGAILLSMAWLAGQEGLLGRLLLCRPLQWLGSISFEMYVLQFVAFYLYNYAVSPVLGHWGWDVYGLLPWCSLPLLVALSWLVNRCFTRPVTRYVNAKILS